MKSILLLSVVVAAKELLTKGFMLILILFSLWLKGKSIKNSALEWNKYFLSIKESFLNRYFTALYSISTILSSCTAYVLFNVFGFQNPLLKTILLTAVCTAVTVKRYINKGKQTIKDGVCKLKKHALEENAKVF